MMVDCRGLIEFCKTFEHRRNKTPGQKPSVKVKRSLPLIHHSTACNESPAAAVDIIIFLIVLGASGFLFTPYFKYICVEIGNIIPIILLLFVEIVSQAPIAYIVGFLLMLGGVVFVWGSYQYQCRKCGNPHCKGLKKSMEFDIQLETEKCVKNCSPHSFELGTNSSHSDGHWIHGDVVLGKDHKELEAELRRMAPPNGRTVLIFRATCGCPVARMEVWAGSKKVRKLKKLS